MRFLVVWQDSSNVSLHSVAAGYEEERCLKAVNDKYYTKEEIADFMSSTGGGKDKMNKSDFDAMDNFMKVYHALKPDLEVSDRYGHWIGKWRNAEIKTPYWVAGSVDWVIRCGVAASE